MNAARRQVVAAVRQARDAWRDAKAEMHEHDAVVDEPSPGRQAWRRRREQVERELQRAQIDAQRAKQDAAREAQRLRQQARQHRRGGPQR